MHPVSLPALTFLVLAASLRAQLPEPTVSDASTTASLQAILTSGSDLALRKGAVYEITDTLRYTQPGQRIYTADAVFPSDYATLRIANKDLMMLINAGGIEGAVLERVICDGNRYELSVVPKPRIGGGGQPAMVHFGAPGGDNQIVRDCVFMNTRTWSTLKMHEFAFNLTVENNLFLGAGVDPRGNGREFDELPFNWSDAISCAARDSVIRNNLIIDPTDVGVVLYGAPGTVVENNLVAAVSRESLGGINLVDGFPFHAIEGRDNHFSYHGAIVRNNTIDAFGARIHMAIPVGAAIWVPQWKGRIYVGGTVTGNAITGGAAAYGIVAHGLKDWTITDNTSSATYSGQVEFGNHPNPPEDPAAFLFDAESVLNSELQADFQAAQRHLVHLLRTTDAPENEIGYQMHDYGDSEVIAVVDAAYLEMLGRAPREKEAAEAIHLLRSRQRNADGLRRQLMLSNEFREKYGEKLPGELHSFRVQLWFTICDNLIRAQGGFTDATQIYRDALEALRNTQIP